MKEEEALYKLEAPKEKVMMRLEEASQPWVAGFFPRFYSDKLFKCSRSWMILQRSFFPGRDHGRRRSQGQSNYFNGRKLFSWDGQIQAFNWKLFYFPKYNDTVPFAQEDTFEEEPQEQKDSCQDWQQLQQLGLWDVVCGSGINISTKFLNLGHCIHYYNPKGEGARK